jgi:hypothetical protein
MEADFLVNARGRSAPGAVAITNGPSTVALGVRYAASLTPSTLVTTSAQGWAWLAAPSAGDTYLQLSVDAVLPGRRALPEHFNKLLSSFPDICRKVLCAEAVGPIQARIGGARVSAQPAQDRVLRVGDAVLAIDPLSGHGVFEAITGAFAAAASINTILRRPHDADLARRFYAERAQEVFAARAHTGQSHYGSETRWSDSPYWRARESWPGIKRKIPRRCAIGRRAVIDNGWIRERDVIFTPEQPRGVWRFNNVPIVELWKLRTSGSITNAEGASRALDVSIPRAASALAWLDRISLPLG